MTTTAYASAPLRRLTFCRCTAGENLSALWRSSSTLAPYSLRNVMDYLATYDADPFHHGELRLMVERKEDEEPLGFVELYEVEVLHRRANVGILIDPASSAAMPPCVPWRCLRTIARGA